MTQPALIQPPAVYVDECVWPFRRMLMCHMLADRLDDLHAMADQIGVARRWFQGRRYPHWGKAKTNQELHETLMALRNYLYTAADCEGGIILEECAWRIWRPNGGTQRGRSACN